MRILSDANRLLAYGFLVSYVRKKKAENREPDDEAQEDICFGDLEKRYEEVLDNIENNNEVRDSLVDKLKKMRKSGVDLNKLYKVEDIVEKSGDSITKMIFLDD